MNDIELLRQMIKESNNIVVLTGAGVSTDSGIKDFRGKDGLSKESSIPLEILLSSDYFYSHTEDFYEFYKEYFSPEKIKPNITHKYLKKLEDEQKLKAIITQNIDGLHSKAGSKTVYVLHGTTYKYHCIKCNKKYDYNYVFNCDGVPRCSCGGIIKPDVVLYGEMLPVDALENSIRAVSNADMLMVLGSSLVVYPAAGLIDYFNGKNFVIINNDETSYDKEATLVIHKNLSDVFKELEKGE